MGQKFGQHFLTDQTVLDDIMRSAALTKNDVVLEIGPGKGIVTEALVHCVRQVIAVELDRGLVAGLQKKFYAQKNVIIIHDDILRWWPNGIFKYLNIETLKQYKMVANLPYGITSRVMRIFLDRPPRPSRMVVMVQKEVAERICAAPGDMSLLSVAVQLYGSPHIVRIVSPAAFNPPPKVDSAILVIDPFMHVNEEEAHHVLQLAKIGFSSRRKQLHNLLAHALSIASDDVRVFLARAGLTPTVRAQELSLESWKQLAQLLFSRHV